MDFTHRGCPLPRAISAKTNEDLTLRVSTAKGATLKDVALEHTVGTDAASTIHIRNLPSSVIVYNGQGTTAPARTVRYYYDGTAANSPSPIPVTGYSDINGIDPAYNVSGRLMRGNPTRMETGVDGGASRVIVTSKTYDVAGNVRSSTDGKGQTTTSAYDDSFSTGTPLPAGMKAYAFATTIQPPAVGAGTYAETLKYDYFVGKPTSHTAIDQSVTSYDWEQGSLDRLRAVTRGTDGAKTSYTYCTAGATTGCSSENSVTTVRDLDDQRTVKSVELFDGLGRRTSKRTYEDASTWVVSYEYDGMSRVSRVSYPYRSSSGSPGCYTETGYDSLGRAKRVSSTCDGMATTTTYAANTWTVEEPSVAPATLRRKYTADAFARVVSVTEADTTVTTYGYDALDNLTSVCQNLTGAACGLSRSFQYDSLSRLTFATNPETSPAAGPAPIKYEYDDNGNLHKRTDTAGQVVTTEWDAWNRMLSRTYAPATTPAATWTWDTVHPGKLSSVWSSAATQSYTYDASGRVSTSSEQVGADPPYVFSNYSWNKADLLTSLTLPSKRVISYGYDNAGRTNAVTGSGNATYVSAVKYAPQEAIQQVTLGTPNNLVEETCFNSRQQPTGIRLGIGSTSGTCVNGADVLNLGFDYGAKNNGNIASQTVRVNGSSFVASYTYDNWNRLKTAAEAGGWSQTYVYDPYGNRALLSGTGNYIPGGLSTPQVTGDDPNQVAAQFANNRWTGAVYDGGQKNVGNVTGLPGYTFSYDPENRLVQATPTGGAATMYSYDGDGRRVKKEQGSTRTVYVYDALGQLAAEYSTGATQNKCARCYLTADHLGSTRLMVDGSSEAAVARYDYTPFGEDIFAWTGARTPAMGYAAQPDVFSIKFTGKERDSETGLDYFGARYFSAAQGRFTSPDWSPTPQPIPYADLTDPQTLNLYSYVRNNPLSRTDPDGHCCEAVADFGREFTASAPPWLKPAGYLIIGAGIVGTALTSPDVREAVSDFVTTSPTNSPMNPVAMAIDESVQGAIQKSPPNPNGQQGAPDHQAEVQKQTDKAQAGAKPGETVLQGKKIQGADSTRRPDVQVVGPDGKVVKVVEVERRPNSQRHTERQKEYDRLGVPHETVPLPKKKPDEN